MASPSARKRKQPPDYVPISPRPERCETLFQSTHSISCSYELWRVHTLTFILYGQSREQCSSRPLPSLLTPALIICLPLSIEDGLYTTSTTSTVLSKESAHSPILTFLGFFDVLRVTAHHAKFLLSESKVELLSSHTQLQSFWWASSHHNTWQQSFLQLSSPLGKATRSIQYFLVATFASGMHGRLCGDTCSQTMHLPCATTHSQFRCLNCEGPWVLAQDNTV